MPPIPKQFRRSGEDVPAAVRDPYSGWSDKRKQIAAASVRASQMTRVSHHDMARLVADGFLNEDEARERGCPEAYLAAPNHH